MDRNAKQSSVITRLHEFLDSTGIAGWDGVGGGGDRGEGGGTRSSSGPETFVFGTGRGMVPPLYLLLLALISNVGSERTQTRVQTGITFWEATQSVFIVQQFNLSDAQELLSDMKAEAEKHDQIRNTVEKYVIAQVEKDFQYVMWQLKHIFGPSARTKRNIFGSVISSLTGLATIDQMQVEHKAVVETNEKIRKLLKHELDLDEVLKNLTNSATTKAEFSRMIGAIQKQNLQESLYRSRQVK